MPKFRREQPAPPVAQEPAESSPARPPTKMPAALGATFAERRAAPGPAVPPRRRLASLGTGYSLMHTRSGGTEMVLVELFYDVAEPMKRYAQFPGSGGLSPLFDDSGGRDEVQELPPVGAGGLGRPAGAFDPSQPDDVRELEPGSLSRPQSSAYPDPLPDPPPRPVV